MAEEEDWTVVNSKSSRSKKSVPNRPDEVPVNRPQNRRFQFQGERQQYKNKSTERRKDAPGAGAHQSRQFDKVVGTSESNKSANRKAVTAVGPSLTVPTQPMPMRILKRDLGKEGSNSSAPPGSVHGHRNINSTCLKKVENGANKISNVNVKPAEQSSNSNANVNLAITKKSFPVNTLPQPQPQYQQDKAGSSPSLPAQDPSVDPATPKKKKTRKRDSKECRRRKREEKFYQALYQNKDSHIQFVSADVIRKLRSDNESYSCPSKSRNRITSLQAQSISETEPFQSFGNFPLLTPPGNDATPPGPSYRLACSSLPNPNTPVSSARVTFTVVPGEELCTPPAAEPLPICTTPLSSRGKKSIQPIVIDFSELIVKRKEKGVDKKHSLKETTVTPPAKSNVLKKNHKLTAGNPLDSSGPAVIHRGKIRNKQKKPTKLKLTIMKSRTLRKILFESQVKQEEDEQSSTITNDEKLSMADGTEGSVIDSVNVEPADNSWSESDSLLQTSQIEKLDVEPTEDMVQSAEVESAGGDLLSAPSVTEKDEKQVIDIKMEIPSPPTDFQLKFSKLLDEVSRLKIEETVPQDVESLVKKSMHSRKFRDYCDMYKSKELHHHVVSLLSELFRFQDRLYHNDPIKFKTKRRFISGLKEALSYLNLNKVQLLLIAPDIEKNPEKGGLDEKINQILTVARENNVPYVFSGSKYSLGKPIRVKTPISIIAVLDKQNCEEIVRTLLSEANLLREKYRNDFISKVSEIIKPEN